jgi:CHAT domain-containing protein
VASLFAGRRPAIAPEDAVAILDIQAGRRDHYRSAAGFELWLGPEATPERFRSEAPRFSILHLAAHGCTSTPGYADPILALTASDGRDGALTCRQLVHMELTADLVVLAACDTARGRMIDGEGVLSLARAFLHAGAREVIASLWEARDLEAGHLMSAFYRRLLEDGSKPAAALRQVKLEMLSGTTSRGKAPHAPGHLARFTEPADPYYWAAFVSIGVP